PNGGKPRDAAGRRAQALPCRGEHPVALDDLYVRKPGKGELDVFHFGCGRQLQQKAETRSSWRSPEQAPAWLMPATAGTSTLAGAADLGWASDRRQNETTSASASQLRKKDSWNGATPGFP